jgi:hypothetical protein
MCPKRRARERLRVPYKSMIRNLPNVHGCRQRLLTRSATSIPTRCRMKTTLKCVGERPWQCGIPDVRLCAMASTELLSVIVEANR